MTDQIREQVSALLDGELPSDEMGLLVRRLERDADLRRAFGNYALIGEALRAPGAPLASLSFASRVSAAIDATRRSHRRFPATVGAGQAHGKLSPPAGGNCNRRQRRHCGRAPVPAVHWARTHRRQRGPRVPPGRNEFTLAASPTPAQSQRLAGYMVVHSQFATPMVRRNVWSGLLAADPGLTRVSYGRERRTE